MNSVARLSALLCVLSVCSAATAKQTNFLFFLVDDMGWADVSCFGSKFHETPHIDKLAASGMKFTAKARRPARIMRRGRIQL
jgi:hypothetical protein